MSKKQITAKDVVAVNPILVKQGDVIGAFEASVQLAQIQFNVITGFKISKIYKTIRQVVEDFEKLKDELREKYATKETLENHQIKYNFGTNEKLVQERIKSEMMKELTLNLPKLTLDELKDKQLQPSILADLDWLISE